MKSCGIKAKTKKIYFLAYIFLAMKILSNSVNNIFKNDNVCDHDSAL